MGLSLDELVDIRIVSSAGNELLPNANGSLQVEALNLDIRDLVFATDKVDASGTTLGSNSGVDIGDVTINNAAGAGAVNIQDGGNSITVDAVDLDIRDLAFATDKVDVSGSTISTAAALYAAIKNSVETVTTTAAQVLATPLTDRAEVTIQNEGNQDVYMGHNASVTSANGIKISKKSSATYLIPAAVDIYMIADTGSQSVRFLELGY